MRQHLAVDWNCDYLCRRSFRGKYRSEHDGASLMWLEAILLSLIVLGGTAGELCITRAMKVIGEVKDFRPLALLRVFGRAMQVGWMWFGLALMGIGFFAMLTMLSMENVSFVVPVTALSYAAGAYGGRLFLGERVTPVRWAGILLVCLGVVLVWQGKGERFYGVDGGPRRAPGAGGCACHLLLNRDLCGGGIFSRQACPFLRSAYGFRSPCQYSETHSQP